MTQPGGERLPLLLSPSGGGPPGWGGVLKQPRAPCPLPEPPCLAVSFHRNSTVTLRPRADGQRAQGGDNDYAQPPQKSSHLTAYAGEGWDGLVLLAEGCLGLAAPS